MIWLLFSSLLGSAYSAGELPPGEPSDVRIGLSSGAVVDWTRVVVEVSHGHAGSGVTGPQPTSEQLARNGVGPDIVDGLPEVRATADQTVGDLLDEAPYGPVLKNRFDGWSVVEATYFASGRVELVCQLDLGDFLRPWTMAIQRPAPLSMPESEWTGLVIDARGSGVLPAFSPKALAPDHSVLWDGHLWEGAALQRSPAVWVNDPAHPAVARAGDHPLVVRAAEAVGADLVIDETGTAQVRAHLLGGPAFGEGRVVVLVDR